MCNNNMLEGKSLEIYNILNLFIKENGFPPTIREIKMRSTLKSTSSVKLYLDKLEKIKLIEITRRSARAIKLLNTNAK